MAEHDTGKIEAGKHPSSLQLLLLSMALALGACSKEQNQTPVAHVTPPSVPAATLLPPETTITPYTLSLMTPNVFPTQTSSPAVQPTVVEIPTATEVNPFTGKKLYVDHNSRLENYIQTIEAKDKNVVALLEKVAQQPTADWFGDWNSDIEHDVNARVTQIIDAGAYPIMVLYNIPNRDYGGYSAGGAKTDTDYLMWIDSVVKGLNGRSVSIILEPDALGMLDKAPTPQEANQRLTLLDAARRKLQANPQINLIPEVSLWVPAEEMARRLNEAGFSKTAEVAMNVSGYNTNATVLSYLKQLQQAMGRTVHAVIDTSRNGAGIPQGIWCNPKGAALGNAPTTSSGIPDVDAFLWIKPPAESDGTCNGGPPAGQIFPEQIISLAQNAGY